MPFYDYKCIRCNYEFEEFQYIKDKPLVKCPECGGYLKRLICRTNIQVSKDSNELGEQLKQEARKEAQDIRDGDLEKAADYLGEKRALDFYRTK
jgi:putative FmdB family regulatory protein